MIEMNYLRKDVPNNPTEAMIDEVERELKERRSWNRGRTRNQQRAFTAQSSVKLNSRGHVVGNG